MAIASVSKSILFAELLAKMCADEGFGAVETADHLSKLSPTNDAIIVILHVAANEALTDLGLRDFRSRLPTARVIAIGDPDTPQDVADELLACAEAVIVGDVSPKVLLGFLTVVDAGFHILKDTGEPPAGPAGPPAPDLEVPRPPDGAEGKEAGVDGAKPVRLSGREMEVLRLLSEGSSNKEIAKKLRIVENTVKVHLRSCYTKIGVRNRTQAALWGTQNRW